MAKKKLIIGYAVSVIVSAAMVIWYLFSRSISDISEVQEKYRILCDAFTLPGLFFILLGLLMVVSNEGAFYALSWLAVYGIRTLIPGQRVLREKYGDYVLRKREKGKTTGFSFLFVTGGVMMAVAIVFLILFYRTYALI